MAIIGDSGGQSGIAADVAVAAGLTVPQLPAAVAEHLAGQLPPGAACTNPVDLAGAGERDLKNYINVVDQVMAGGEIDAVVMTGYFGSYGQDIPSLADAEASVAERLGAVVSATGIPVLVHTMAPESATAQALWRHGVPAYGRIESAMGALAGLGRAVPSHRPVELHAVPSTWPVEPGYWAARALLSQAGVDVPARCRGAHRRRSNRGTTRAAAPGCSQGGLVGAQERNGRGPNQSGRPRPGATALRTSTHAWATATTSSRSRTSGLMRSKC